MPRYFTLDEARAALPAVGRNIREAVNARARCGDAEKRLQDLTHRILMTGGMAVDTSQPEAWKSQYEAAATVLKTSVERIEEQGVLVKDLDTGLVDFPTLLRGEEVYLCWRMDEADIDHWHGIHEGFAGRKAIDRSFVENHRGEP